MASEGSTENGHATEELSEEGEWLRKAEAAVRLGITERTVDNRIGQGKLQKRVGPDGTIEVLVPLRSEELQATRALALIERYNEALTRQTLPLVAQIRELSETVGRLTAENENLQKQLQNSVKPVGRPWWRFWAGW